MENLLQQETLTLIGFDESRDPAETLKDIEGLFDRVWKLYPSKDGRKAALRHFKASVKTVGDLSSILIALHNYLQSGNVKRGFIKNGSTWFNNWQDWTFPSPSMMRGTGQIRRPPADQAMDWANNDSVTRGLPLEGKP